MRKTVNTRKVGSAYEDVACDYLTGHGLQVIARNYRKRIGEIDIIARDCRELVFIEVKYRKSIAQGGAAWAIPFSKQKTIRRVAQWYLSENHISQDAFVRFDAILIDGDEITHIKNAF